MKIVYLVLALLLTLPVFGQINTKESTLKLSKIQGGILYDAKVQDIFSTSSLEVKDYLGVNILNVGFLRWTNKKIRGIDAELIFFLRNKQSVVQERRSAEINIYQTYAIIGGDKAGLFIGPFASMHITFKRFSKIIPL